VTARPPFEGSIVYGPRKEHCWFPLSQRELMDQMAAASSRPGTHPVDRDQGNPGRP